MRDPVSDIKLGIGWRNGLVVKSTCCSYRELRSVPSIHGQLTITCRSEVLTPSSGLHRHWVHMVLIYNRNQNIHIRKKCFKKVGSD